MNLIDEIKSRIDIVDLIGGHVQLKKAGRNYKGLCPFHSEKTPSFVVFPDTQHYRCFGCGKGGDIFNFVMEREGWEFGEALRYLAAQAGVELEPLAPQQVRDRQEQDRLRALLADATLFFHSQLLDTPAAAPARAYVEQRGLTLQTVRSFEIGYAPPGWDVTAAYLLGKGYQQQELIDVGLLIVREEDGRAYDRFRDRLMIPIRDGQGKVVGFGARALAKDAQPKYLNSPQSALFDKSKLLFGLSHARRSIRESETAVIVEGYMDVMQAHQAGFNNVVAQMGTALTEAQLRMLARYANRLVLALDPDVAGQTAVARGREVIERVSKAAAEQAGQEGVWDFDAVEREYRAKLTTEFDARGMVRYESRLGFDIRVAILPEGHDPDDLIRESPQAWAELIEGALPIVEYVIQTTIAGQDLADPKVKSRVAGAIIPLINDIANPVERDHYRQRLARLLKVDERVLLVDKPSSPHRESRQPEPKRGSPLIEAEDIVAASPTLSREAFCLAALIRHPHLIYRVNRTLAEALDPVQLLRSLGDRASDGRLPAIECLARKVVADDFRHVTHQIIFANWQMALSQDEVEAVTYLMGKLDDAMRKQVHEWLSQPLYAIQRGVTPPATELSYEKVQEEAIMGLLELRSKSLGDRIHDLTQLMWDADKGGDGSLAKQYGTTILLLQAALDRIGKVRIRYTSGGKRSAPSSPYGRSRLYELS